MLTHQYNQRFAEVDRKVAYASTILAEQVNSLQLKVAELESINEKNHIVLQEQNRNMHLLQLRVEKLEAKLNKVYP